MKGTIQIARFANIPVLLHWSFGLVLLSIMYIAIIYTGDWLSMFWIMSIIVSIFVCVILHEYGHALMARRFGVGTRDIILSPIGGVARLEYLPEKPSQELWIALAGPFVNILIALILSPYFLLVADSLDICTELVQTFVKSFNIFSEQDYYGDEVLLSSIHSLSHFIPIIIGMNLILAIFNMIPAFPMDGGRVLRALFSFRLSRLRATTIATFLGWLCAVFFIYKGVVEPNPVLVVIGIFVFFAAYQEFQMVRRDALLNTHNVRDIIRTNFTKISATETMQSVINNYQKDKEGSFLVVDFLDRVTGVLPENIITKTAKKASDLTLVEQYQQNTYETISPNESLKWLFHKMQTKGYYILPVYESGKIIGVVDRKGFSDFLVKKRRLF